MTYLVYICHKYEHENRRTELGCRKYFVDAVEQQSISRSSEINHISRPAVSQSILRLGDWYGARLLKHEKRSFALTPAGAQFYEQAKELLAGMEVIFQSTTGRGENSLKLGISASLMELVFPLMSKTFAKAQNPLVKIGTSEQLLQDLKDKKIHLAIVVDRVENKNYSSQVIHRGKYRLYSKTGRWHSTLVTTEERPETLALKAFRKQSKAPLPENHLQAESWSTVAQLALWTGGVCLLPDYLKVQGLKLIPEKDWKFEYEVRLYWSKSSSLSLLEQKMIQDFAK